MDTPGWVLLAWFLGSALLLIVVEGWCIYAGLPTISDRVRSLGDSRIVIIISTFVVGYLAAHFSDRNRDKSG